MINNLADAFRRAFKNIYESLKEEEIRIVKKGNRITAAYYVDGECVRHANSKCSIENAYIKKQYVHSTVFFKEAL